MGKSYLALSFNPDSGHFKAAAENFPEIPQRV